MQNSTAIADVDLEEEDAAIIVAKELHTSARRRFLQGGTSGPDIETLHHNATVWWLKSLDRALRICTGAGLEQFASARSPISDETRANMHDLFGDSAPRRYLAIAADQCSVGLSATTFLDQILHLRTEMVMDVPHRR